MGGICGARTPDFEMDGAKYRFILNELDEIGGCAKMDGSDFQECSDCIFETNCPGQTEPDEEE
jgi:hypothetical protein